MTMAAMLAVLACRRGPTSVEGLGGTSTTESSGSEPDAETSDAETSDAETSDAETSDAETSETGEGDPLPPSAHVLLTLSSDESPSPAHSLHVLDVLAPDPAASLTLLAQDRWSVRGSRADGITLLTNWDARELALLDLDTDPATWHPIELPPGNEAVYGRWLPNGQDIMLVARDTNLDRERIWRVAVDVAGVPSAPELLTPATEPGFETQLFTDGFEHEVFSEDGRTLAFLGRIGADGPWQVYVLDLDDPEGDLLRLTELTYMLVRSLHLTPDGGELIYTELSLPFGGSRVWQVDLEGGSTTSELIEDYPGYVYVYQWINPRTALLVIDFAALAVLQVGDDAAAITRIDTGDVAADGAYAVGDGDWLLVVGSEPDANERTLYRMKLDGLVAGPLEPIAGAAVGEPHVYSFSTQTDSPLIWLGLASGFDSESPSYENHIAQVQDGELVERWFFGYSSLSLGPWSVQDQRLVAWLEGDNSQLVQLDLDDPEAVGVALTPVVPSSVHLNKILRAPASDRVLFLQGSTYETLELKMVELDAPQQVTTISPSDHDAVEAWLVP
jgi:hypothetical protein